LLFAQLLCAPRGNFTVCTSEPLAPRRPACLTRQCAAPPACVRVCMQHVQCMPMRMYACVHASRVCMCASHVCKQLAIHALLYFPGASSTQRMQVVCSLHHHVHQTSRLQTANQFVTPCLVGHISPCALARLYSRATKRGLKAQELVQLCGP